MGQQLAARTSEINGAEGRVEGPAAVRLLPGLQGRSEGLGSLISNVCPCITRGGQRRAVREKATKASKEAQWGPGGGSS